MLKKIIKLRPVNLTKTSTIYTKNSLFSHILYQSTLNHVFSAPSSPRALRFPAAPCFFYLIIPAEGPSSPLTSDQETAGVTLHADLLEYKTGSLHQFSQGFQGGILAQVLNPRL